MAVHAYGTPRVMTDDALRDHLDALAAIYEAPRANGWDSGKLPGDVFEKLRRAIVGFVIPITRLEGKWKLGQNRTAADRLAAIEGLRSTGAPDDSTLADWMATAMGTETSRDGSR